MKKYSILNIPLMSFFSKALYIDIGQNWKGTGFAYLLLLLAVCWIPTVISIQSDYAKAMDEYAPSIVEQFPRIEIRDGEVYVDAEQPYAIFIPDTQEAIIVLDTTGEITSLAETEAKVLLTRTSISIEKNDYQTQTQDLSQVKSFIMERSDIYNWIDISKKFIGIIFYPFAVAGSYIFRIIQVLIYAAIGLIFVVFFKVNLKYNDLLRLAVAAVTPCIITKTVLDLLDVDLPVKGWIYFLAALGLLFYGVKACSQAGYPPPLVREDISPKP